MLKLKQNFHIHFYILPSIFLIIILYFTYHLIQGERGIFRLFVLNDELKQAEQILSQTQAEKQTMETRVNLLSTQKIDADLLDETLRKELGLTETNEYVIFD